LPFHLAFPFTEPAINPSTKKQPIKTQKRVLGRARKIGRKAWKETAGYHRRAPAVTSMFRFKAIFDDHLSARLLKAQVAQVLIGGAELNRMTHLGMPESSRVVPFGKAA
jgi:hypothetical protein